MRVRVSVPIVDLRPYLPAGNVRRVQNLATALAAGSTKAFWRGIGRIQARGETVASQECTANFLVPFRKAMVIKPEEQHRLKKLGLTFQILASYFCQDSPKTLHTRLEYVFRIPRPGTSVQACLQLLGTVCLSARALQHQAPLSDLATLARGQYLHATTTYPEPEALARLIRDNQFREHEPLVAAGVPTVICELDASEEPLIAGVQGATDWGKEQNVTIYKAPFGFGSGWLLVNRDQDSGAIVRMQSAIASLEGESFTIATLTERLGRDLIPTCEPPELLPTRKSMIARSAKVLSIETQFGLPMNTLRFALAAVVDKWTALEDAEAIKKNLDQCPTRTRPQFTRFGWLGVAVALVALALFAWRSCSPTPDRPPQTRDETPVHLREALPAAGSNNLWLHGADSDTVFVFVHGIFSDSRSCWWHIDPGSPASDRYWPEMVVQDQRFDTPSVYLGGFYTALASGSFDMSDCAAELFMAMRTPDLKHGVAPISKPNIVFIGHSTGGIVIRHMLDEHYEDFRDKSIGVVLIASPSLGSEWASRLKLLIAAAKNSLSSQLRWNEPTLVELDNRFKDLLDRKKIPTLVGAEAYENRFILFGGAGVLVDRLVTRESASRYFGRPTQLSNTDHFSCVKPHSMDGHPAHRFLLDFYLSKFQPLKK